MYSHGAVCLDPRHARFALWAPDCHTVAVEFQDGSLHGLQPEDGGWFARTLECTANTCYRFVIDGGLRVPDPASRRQVDTVHGFSQLVDHRAYPWQHTSWHGRPWREAVIYELHAGLFGGFQQLEAHLPHMAEMGITAMQLMPLAAFPGRRNWGYDGVLPFAPASSYGSPEQLKALIDKAHELNLMVFADVVYNHFGPDGNYLGQYASAFFRDDRMTPWGAAIDFRRPQVRDFFCENALMWLLDYRVDGLRLDAVHAIDDNDFLIELAERVRDVLPAQRHVHLVVENENNSATLLEQGFDAQWNDDGHNSLHVLLTGEQEGYYADYAEDTTDKLATCLEQGFIYQGQPTRQGRCRGEPSSHLPPMAFVLFLQNHDQVGNRALGERLSCLADPDALKAATLLLLLSPMVPLVFMGDEWGSRQPFLFFSDYQGELARAVREGRRNEFAEFSSFSSQHARQEIPDPNDPATFERSRPVLTPDVQPEQAQWLAFYRHLLDLRREHVGPGLDGVHSLGAQTLGEASVSASWRLGNGHRLRIDLNLGGDTVCLAPPSPHMTQLCAHRVDPLAYRQGKLPARSAQVLMESAP